MMTTPHAAAATMLRCAALPYCTAADTGTERTPLRQPPQTHFRDEEYAQYRAWVCTVQVGLWSQRSEHGG